MPKYDYIALDSHGKETKGSIEVGSQNEAIGRVKEMGLFPTKIVEADRVKEKSAGKKGQAGCQSGRQEKRRRVKPRNQNPRPRWRGQAEGVDDVHAATGDARGRGPAAVARIARARKTGAQCHAQAHSRRAGPGHRGRQHLFRGARPASQSVQPPVCQHGQGGRTGRRAGSGLETAGGILRKSPKKSKARSSPRSFTR